MRIFQCKEYFTSGPKRSKSPIVDMFSMDTDLMPHNSIEHSNESIISITQHNNAIKQQNRCIEDRIESAKKLVKKLSKFCPYYEVTVNGEDAGRVFCKICERHLGAVSSTLKNHINTQEHKQAVEDSHNGSPNASNNGSSVKNNCLEISRIGPNASSRSNPHPSQLVINTGITGQNSPHNSAFDFESFDIQWVPSYQPITNMEYCVSDNQIGTGNQISTTAVQNRTITNL